MRWTVKMLLPLLGSGNPCMLSVCFVDEWLADVRSIRVSFFLWFQTQLVLHMAQMGDKYFCNGTRLRKPAKHPVDIRKFASANNGMLDQFALWNIDPTRRPLTEGTSGLPPPARSAANPLGLCFRVMATIAQCCMQACGACIADCFSGTMPASPFCFVAQLQWSTLLRLCTILPRVLRRQIVLACRGVLGHVPRLGGPRVAQWPGTLHSSTPKKIDTSSTLWDQNSSLTIADAVPALSHVRPGRMLCFCRSFCNSKVLS